MSWSDHGRGLAWLFALAVALIPFGADAEDEAPDGDRGEYALPDVGADDESAEEAAEKEPFAGVEEITVTVQKRSQTLQKVPAAASALTGRLLDAAGIEQVQDLQSFVPNMHYGQERGEAKITLRGVANAQGTDQSTAVHTDGIFQNRARSITSLTFFDIQRVEILRGPQGTLYGRNATGGAMNIISVPPSDKIEALADFQIGNYDQMMVRGVLNVPLVDDLAALRVSGFWENRDGYQENLFFTGSDHDADDADDFGIRSQLLLTPHDSVETTLRFNYARKRGVGYALKRDGPLPESVVLIPDFKPLDEQPIYDGATPNPDNDRRVFLDTKGDIDNETISGNTNVEWEVPKIPFFGATKLRVLGSFSDFDDHSVIDQDYSDLMLAVANQAWEGNEWVGEIDWSSDYGEDAGWLLGIFHLGTTSDNVVDAPSTIPILTDIGTRFNIPVPFYQDFETRAYSLAGFVNGWYHLTEKLRVEAGVRYSHDWKKSELHSPTIFLREEGQPPTSFVLFQGINDHRTDDWGEPTGSFSLDYPITDDSLLYGRFSTGYKAGTLNNDMAPIGGKLGDDDCYEGPNAPNYDPDAPNCDGIFSPEDADPENLYALEAGLKNSMLDKRLLLNGTAFIYWYHDLQVSQLFEAQNYVENAADARIFGIELESTWIPTGGLTFEAQFSFLDTNYTDYKGCRDAKDFSVQDCTGNELSRAPRFSGSFAVMYRFDFDRFGSITPFAQIYASDKVYFRPTNETADTQNAYYLLNFRIGWRSEDLRLGLDAFIDNALDKDVATTKLVGSSLLGSPLVDAYDRPRTFGARASLAW